ncbi:MAG: hypothetical protein ACUVXG_05905 [Anaerolineae bacterium]
MTKKKMWWIGGAVLTVFLVAGLIGAASVFAQDPTPTPQPTKPFGWFGGMGRGFGWPGGGRGWGGFGLDILGRAGRLSGKAFDAAAEALGLTPEGLFSELHAGKTLAEIAEAQGVDLADVRAAIGAVVQAGRDPWAAYDAAAEALGLTPEGLFSELHAGKTLAEIAEAQGVEMEAVQEALNAARIEAQKQAIEQAVEDGRLTREQADWMLEGLDKGFFAAGKMRGFGFGFGGGRGGRMFCW